MKSYSGVLHLKGDGMELFKQTGRNLRQWSWILLALPTLEVRAADMTPLAPAAEVQVRESASGSTAEAKSLDEAQELLTRTEVLESAYVGFVLARSTYLEALFQLVESEDALPRLQRLYEEGTLAGKMYALIGLQLIPNPEAFQEHFDRALSESDKTLRVYDGCVMSQSQLTDTLEKIREGFYQRSFQDAWQGNSQGPL